MWDFKHFNSNIAIKDEYGTEVPYSLLNEECSRLSKFVDRRCLVFVLCRNSIGSIIGYVACVNNCIVPLLLNSQLDDDLLHSLMEAYKPAYMWVPDDKLVYFHDWDCCYKSYGYSLIKTHYECSYEINPELCLLLTTSGSTGSPKLVRQSYKNVKSNAAAIVQYLGITNIERPITTLPMNYTYGLSIINSHLMVGATLLVTDKGLMQKEFWKFFKDNNATSFGGVPYTYEMLDRLRFYRMQLPSLRYCTQAGGKLTPELHKKFAEDAINRGTKFIVMYGQCEATARMGYLPAEKSLEKYGSMGIAIPGGSFNLIDVNGDEITAPNVTGELVYKGDNVTLGYAENWADLSKGDERNGVLQTGDMAQFDQDGYYYIVGRKKRFLKIYGNRINLDEIDRLIKEYYNNIDCASSGIDDHLYIFVTDSTYSASVKEFVSAKTGLNAAAFKVVVIDEIPKNDSGKTLYKELAKYY